MELTLNGEIVDRDIDDALIDESLQSLSEDDSFMILAKDEMTYMQTTGDPGNGFILEYQEGSMDEHYSCAHPVLGLSEVSRAFKQYLHGDERWKSDLRWEKEGYGKAGAGITFRQIFLLLAIFLVVLFVWGYVGAA